MRTHRTWLLDKKKATNRRQQIKTIEATSCFAKVENTTTHQTKNERCTKHELKSTNKMAKSSMSNTLIFLPYGRI